MTGGIKIRWSVKKRCMIGVGLTAAALLLLAVSAYIPSFAQWYAVAIYPLYVGSMGRIMEIFPFSVVEMLLYLFLLGVIGSVIYTIIKMIRTGGVLKPAVRWLSGFVCKQ